MRSQDDPARQVSDDTRRPTRRETESLEPRVLAGPGTVQRLQQMVGNSRVAAVIHRSRSGSARQAPQRKAARAASGNEAEETTTEPTRAATGDSPTARTAESRTTAAPPAIDRSPVPRPEAAPAGPVQVPEIEPVAPPPRVTPQRAEGAVSASEGSAQLADAIAETRAQLDAIAPPPVAQATSPGGQLVIDAVTGTAESGRAALVAAATEATQAVAATVDQHAQELTQAETQQIALVRADAAEARTGIDTSVGDQVAAVTAAHADEQTRLGTWRKNTTARANEEVAARADRVRAIGSDQEQRAHAAGDAAATEAAASLTGAASEARGEAGGSGGSAPADEGKAEVSHRVSSDAARQFDSSAADARTQLRAHAGEAGSAVREHADRAASSIGAEAAVLGTHLSETATVATTQIGQAATATAGQLRQHGRAATTQVEAAESDAAEVLRARADEHRGQAAAAGAAAVTGMRQQAVNAVQESLRAQTEAVERLSTAQLDEETGTEVAAEASAQFGEAHDGVAALARATADGVTGELGQTGRQGADELATAATEVGGQLRSAAGRFGTEAGRVGSAATSAFASAAQTATAAGDEAVTATGQQLDNAVTAAGSGFGEATGTLGQALAARTAETGGRAHDALTGTRARIAEGHGRVDSSLAANVPVQRSILSDIGDWFADQLRDLWNMLKSPSFWVGLIVAVVLFPALGPGALVVAGVAAGAVSGIEENVRSGRPWWDPHAIIRNAFVGALAGAAMAFGIGVIVGLGLEGLAALGATMALSAVVGIVTNVATGERWDRGLLANLFLAWLFHRIFSGRGRPGGTEAPAEETPPGGRANTRTPGLYESINPKDPPTGWRFQDTVTRSGNKVDVQTTVTAPDGTTGNMGRSLDTSTGQFTMDYAFLDRIPKPMRMVPTDPEMLPGQGTPLEAYMTMRQMRILEQEAGASFSGPRTVHMSTIINARTVMELAAAEAAGVPINEAIRNTHSVQYAQNSITQSGGRISGVEVTGGHRIPASSVMGGEPARYGVDPSAEVLYGFDIDIHVVPADAPVTPSGGGPVPVPVGPGRDQREQQ